MADLNMQLVREFFELHLFHVLSYWHHDDGPTPMSDQTALLFAENLRPRPLGQPDFLLRAPQVGQLERVMVEVRAWHADRFYSSLVENNEVLGHVAGAEARGLAGTIFDGNAYSTLLVISELPQGPKQRERALEQLRGLGMDHVLEFPTVLQEMLNRVSAYGNYAPSQTLQTLRLLKRYNLVRRQQLEFAFPLEAPPLSVSAPAETTVADEDGVDE